METELDYLIEARDAEIVRLKNQGLSNREIAQSLNERDMYFIKRENRFVEKSRAKANTISTLYSKIKKRGIDLTLGSNVLTLPVKPDPEINDDEDLEVQDAVDAFVQKEENIRRVVREELLEALQDLTTFSEVVENIKVLVEEQIDLKLAETKGLDMKTQTETGFTVMPQERVPGSKKFKNPKSLLSFTLDARLKTQIESLAHNKGISFSHAVESIIWDFCGRPDMNTD